jgi:acyl-CoA synthetase (NDP forming)
MTTLLSETQTSSLFAAYALPMPRSSIVRSSDDAATVARSIGYPVVLKISSPDIVHKTDIGCVRVKLDSDAQVRDAFNEIIANAQKHAPTARVNGVLVQQLLPAGHEFIVGGLRDPSAGPMVMVGLGGIYTELFRDTAFAIAPVGNSEAYRMLQSLRSWKLLTGMRGAEQADIDGLVNVITAISRLMVEHPEVTELDLNPVIVRNDAVYIADAKIIVATSSTTSHS